MTRQCRAIDQLLLLRPLFAVDFFAPPLFDGRPALLRVPVDLFAGLPALFVAPFFAADFLAPRFAVDFFAPFFAGTFAPLSRASDKPIAIACLRLVTVLPLRPDFSLPRFISCSQ